jgi:hypothetical protein
MPCDHKLRFSFLFKRGGLVEEEEILPKSRGRRENSTHSSHNFLGSTSAGYAVDTNISSALFSKLSIP